MAATLLELIRENARTRAERAAFVFLGDGETESETVTFADIAARAERSARRLLARAKPGDRALLLLEPGPDYVDAFLGCWWAGIVPVPAYPPRRNSRTARIELIVENAEPKLALTDDAVIAARFEGRLRVLLAGDTQNDLPSASTAALTPYVARPEDTAFLQYTSGSTGHPRGVMVTHANLLHNERTIRDTFRPHPDELSVTWLPPYHDMGLIGTLLQPLAVGMTTVVLAPSAFLQRPLRWLRAISRYRATYSGGPDFAFSLCARAALNDAPDGLDLSSWEVAYQGAERVRPETLQLFTHVFAPFGFRRAAFAPCFGLAEATLMVTAVGRGEPAREHTLSAEGLERGELLPVPASTLGARRFMACGPPRGGDVRIVDPERLVPCESGRVGEIWVSSPSVAPGYHAGDSDQAAVFRAELPGSHAHWLRTGDLGGFVEGELVITGRLKDLIIVDGKNHAPEDLEATAAESHASFAPHGTAAFSFEEDGRERVVIAQEIRRTALRSFEPEAALRAVKQAVSEAHGVALHDVAFVRPHGLPRTSSGKLRRRACAEAYRRAELPRADAGKTGAAEPNDPRSALEALIRRLLAEELKLSFEAVEPSLPLSSLGLDSLSAEVFTGRLSRELGRELAPTFAYDHPTVERMLNALLDAPAPLRNPLGLDTFEALPAPSTWKAFTPSGTQALPGRWVLFGGDDALEAALESRLKGAGVRARFTRPGSQDLDAAALRAGSEGDAAWELLVRELLPPSRRFTVVAAWPGGSELFDFLRAVWRVGRGDDLVLRVVATGAFPDAPDSSAGDTTLRRGLRALAKRSPKSDVRLVDAGREAAPESVVAALLSAGSAGEIAVRAAGWFVPSAESWT